MDRDEQLPFRSSACRRCAFGGETKRVSGAHATLDAAKAECDALVSEGWTSAHARDEDGDIVYTVYSWRWSR